MSELMWNGVLLMIMGMGTVFVFLAVLVLGTKLMSYCIMQLPAPTEIETSPGKSQRVSNEVLAEVAAVAAAVKLVHER